MLFSIRWGKPDPKSGNMKIVGELYRVSQGTVEVILCTGIKRSFKPVELSKADEKYLEEVLSEADKLTLWPGVEKLVEVVVEE